MTVKAGCSPVLARKAVRLIQVVQAVPDPQWAEASAVDWVEPAVQLVRATPHMDMHRR